MIWFFTRGTLQVDIEVRQVDLDTFELVIDYPNGTEGIERFTNPRKLVRRTLSVQHRLIRDGWVPTGPGMRLRPNRSPARPPSSSPRRRSVPALWEYVHRQVAARLAATFGL